MSETKTAISVDNLAKCYQIYDRPQDRLKQFFSRDKGKFSRNFWALNPVSFEITKGECVGFVGRNGSGKSTLLQILAGIIAPTCGSYKAFGRIAALLELGAGFNHEFTGRENVYLNASILGLSREEIEEKLPSIEKFAEIGQFIDQAVKTYSSGMFIRLAFSVAIHVRPDILLIDEALAVGDAPFQYKCLQKIEELRDQGVSIILVTHDTPAVKRFCGKAGWLHEGRLVSFGAAVDVVHQYEDFSRAQIAGAAINGAIKEVGEVDTSASQNEQAHHARLLSAQIVDAKGSQTNVLVSSGALTLRITYQVLTNSSDKLVIGAAVFRNDDLYVCGLNTLLDKYEISCELGTHTLDLVYPNLSLIPGSYYFNIAVFDGTATVRWDHFGRVCPFTVVGPYVAEGVTVMNHVWQVRPGAG